MNPIESARALLPPPDREHLAGLLAAAPPLAVVSMWVPRFSVALLVVRIDGEVTGHLAVWARDAGEGEEIAAGISANLARAYAETRDAREATRLLLRRLAN